MNAAGLLNLLSQHQGRENGIGVYALAMEAGISERQVRKLVSQLRREGTAICAKPKTGYYLAVTPDELRESCAFLHARALHSLQLASRIQNVALPDLLGQLMLNVGAERAAPTTDTER